MMETKDIYFCKIGSCLHILGKLSDGIGNFSINSFVAYALLCFCISCVDLIQLHISHTIELASGNKPLDFAD